MPVLATEVRSVLASPEAAAIDDLIRRALADRLPAGMIQPLWSLTAERLEGCFTGVGAVTAFRDWCDLANTDPVFDFAAPPDLELWADFRIAGYDVRLWCTAEQSEVEAFFTVRAEPCTD
jgi:hypothetical protein